MNPTIVAALIGAGGVVITVLLTFYLWLGDTKNHRDEDLRIASALYINPFIDACEQLQSRLYNVFGRGGLIALKDQYENDEHAHEILFQLARYFGWERIVRRYASYSLDQQIVNLMEDIRATFSTDSIEGGLRFFREEQKSLGQLAVRRVKGAESEFEEVPYHEFVSKLKSGPLSYMKSANSAIESIVNADEDADQINGGKRLVRTQSLLVEILTLMEEPAEYSVFKGTRETLPDTNTVSGV